MDLKNDIEVTKLAIKTKLWRKTADQKEKWLAFLKALSLLHKVDIPGLEIRKTMPNYEPETQTITINKYSVITLLHEFGHHLWLSESDCTAYSEKVFKAAYPKGFERLRRDHRGYLMNGGNK